MEEIPHFATLAIETSAITYTSLENRIDGSSTWLRWTLMESPMNLLSSFEYATVERSPETV